MNFDVSCQVSDDVKPPKDGSVADTPTPAAPATTPAATPAAKPLRDALLPDEDDEEEQQKADREGKISKRKQKLLSRPSIAELKASCARPDVVEWHDVTARDPKLLVHLKVGLDDGRVGLELWRWLWN